MPRDITSNSHVSNPAQTHALRSQINQQATQHPSFYGTLVKGVNHLLHQGGFGISPASHQSVMKNLEQVGSGQMSQATAHFNEASTFGQDAFESVRHGQYGQGAMEALGAVINTVGGTGMSMLQGFGSPKLSVPTPAERGGIGPW